MTIIWVDIKNSHEPFFFKTITSGLSQRYGHDFLFTARDYAEVKDLLDKHAIRHTMVGHHYRGSFLIKAAATVFRDIRLLCNLPEFDIALSHGSPSSAQVGFLSGKPVLSIYDNDLPTRQLRAMSPYINTLFCPWCCNFEKAFDKLQIEQARRPKIRRFRGFKEEIYLSAFQPYMKFLDLLENFSSIKIRPYEYVVIRPEAYDAEYVSRLKKRKMKKKDCFPQGRYEFISTLISSILEAGLKVLFLARYRTDRDFIEVLKSKGIGRGGIIVPDHAINGPAACYYA
ncbi:MAG: DUF354 domain-containing protein, partial [Thermoplasmata archaeon]